MSTANALCALRWLAHDSREEKKMIDKIPQKNLIRSTDKFAVVRVPRKDNHRLKGNEMILPRADYRPDIDHKLIWFDENEPMIYRERYGEIPKCYWDYLEEIKLYLKKQQEVKVIKTSYETEEEKQKRIEKEAKEIEKLILIHQECKQKILEFFDKINFSDPSTLFELNILSGDTYTKDEVVQAVNDVPLFLSDIKQNVSIFIGDNLDERARKLIDSQIKDNRNAERGVVSYICLECYFSKEMRRGIDKY
ncbi:MAG: hypothetical protein ACLRY5_08705, partial [Zhenhengia sp.]